ncbi:MAG: aspartate carbamoyltransferase regulatory subunit [Promethearchaeota archaeon]|nr:MAG: aspartate carbamoyltransferase regulatory subunit [Candidatus Lokiarchaeota archaeon]
MVEENLEESLRIRKIERGTVIDHITPGTALYVLNILNITGIEGDIISVAMNVPSGKLKSGYKDVVKIENRELDSNEINIISLISPNATISIIREMNVVSKKRVEIPDEIHNVDIKCINPNCITNSNEPVKTHYKVKKREPLEIECQYCYKTMTYKDILGSLKK